MTKSAKLEWAHGYNYISSFHAIIDTMSVTQYSVGKYLSELLNSLTRNGYSLKDIFDSTTRITKIFPPVPWKGWVHICIPSCYFIIHKRSIEENC